LKEIQTFNFVFYLFFYGIYIGNHLSYTLQKKYQDIMNIMMLVQIYKQKLQSVSDDDFNDLLGEIAIFCDNNDIYVPNMNDLFVPQGRS